MQQNTSSASSIVVKATGKANGSITNVVSIRSDTTDPDNNSNSQASAKTSIVR